MDGSPRLDSGTSGDGAAFFDVDGTMVSTNIVHQYVHVRRCLARESRGAWGVLLHGLWRPLFYCGCVKYLYLDRISRSRMNVVFYRNYAGLDAEAVRACVEDCWERVLRPHLYREAVDCVRGHREAGRRIVLVTGSIDFLIRPLADYLAAELGMRVDLLARTIVEEGGYLTGELDGPPMGEETKADELSRYAVREGVDLSSSYAYGDSVADVAMMELVGHPTAVNAGGRLARRARLAGWPSVRWRGCGGGS